MVPRSPHRPGLLSVNPLILNDHNWVHEARTLHGQQLAELVASRNKAIGDNREPLASMIFRVPLLARKAIETMLTTFQKRHELSSRSQAFEMLIADRHDQRNLLAAVAQAKQSRQDLSEGLFDFIGDVLSLRARGDLESEFVMRFQQFTAPVMAKGVEDTTLYCFNRMISLNEVGGNPAENGITVGEFHRYRSQNQLTHPFTMLTLSTHDTKRADDVRARLATLSEIPDRWRGALRRWSRMNASFKTGSFPDGNTEYFLYQTLIGAWPITKERLNTYMLKAVREAKQQTSWTQQNSEFEDALTRFIDGIIESETFVSTLAEFVETVTPAGRVNSLSQTLIKLTAPGVPDTYQGGELWDLTLVDPDNRQSIDYEERRRLLGELRAGMDVEEILRRSDSGLPKLWVIHSALSLRRAHPAWFGEDAEYTPIVAEGTRSEHVVAFFRGDSVATIAPRWPLRLNNNWVNTMITLPDGVWRNVLTGDVLAGGHVRVRELLRRFPVALLVRNNGEQNASL